ncbi:KilA-N domain-containing protein [Azotobacter vinelandii]|uniref:KilA-N domain-containing protein n=1 Tax=Azotobacter vinelandii TaxID=354 RepID=UPI0026652BAF|nr:KilA-N domain-containing protein [Azotobacter vinelandii]WKN20834.1 KilA-N domain-containing protein [Azotobacter vinelandii]
MSASIIRFDYQGLPVRFNADGWLHATEIAARFGREPSTWLRQPDTVGYLAALAQALGVEVKTSTLEEFNKIKYLDSSKAANQAKLLRLSKETGLVKTKAGSPETGGGTWLHPKLAVAFARWLDAKFAVWCDMQIDDLLHGTQTPTKSAMQALDEAVSLMEADKAIASKCGMGLARWKKARKEHIKAIEQATRRAQLLLGF